jgi:hypothetical protein
MLLGRREDWSCRVSSVRVAGLQLLLKDWKEVNMGTKFTVPDVGMYHQPIDSICCGPFFDLTV